ncbi:MAG: type II toxin-antitoxin system VapC family toxin [bacterium]
MNLFLDTSAVVKLYHHEEGTDNLLNFLKQYSTDLILTISDITKIEFHSAILKRVRMNEIELDIAKQVFSDFEKDMELMNVVEIDKSIKNRAVQILDELAPTRNFRTLDSLQLSSAIILNESFPIDYFIASDERLLDVVKLYFPIYDPVEVRKT